MPAPDSEISVDLAPETVVVYLEDEVVNLELDGPETVVVEPTPISVLAEIIDPVTEISFIDEVTEITLVDAAGPIGPANTLTVGTVTSTDPGTNASVEITGAAPHQTINFGIPRGDVHPPPITEQFTTSSITRLTTLNYDYEFERSYSICRVVTNHPCRIIFYISDAARTADASRILGVDPSDGSGVVLELVTTEGLLDLPLSPVAKGWIETGTHLPIAITNMHTADAAYTVTITYI